MPKSALFKQFNSSTAIDVCNDIELSSMRKESDKYVLHVAQHRIDFYNVVYIRSNFV